jgi:hypothetical protein
MQQSPSEAQAKNSATQPHLLLVHRNRAQQSLSVEQISPPIAPPSLQGPHTPLWQTPPQQSVLVVHRMPTPWHGLHLPLLHLSPEQHWLSLEQVNPTPRQVSRQKPSPQAEPAQQGASPLPPHLS